MSSKSNHTPSGPPKGNDWGERTKQTFDNVDDAPGYWETDAYEMRRKYGIEQFEFDPDAKYQVYPDVLIHETNPTLTDSEKATNALVEGPKGSGKTTHALEWAYQMLDVNNERALWRGDQRRSGWLPYRYWTTLWLPASVDHEAHWMLEDEEGSSKVNDPVDDLEADADVRDVHRYDDVQDLCDQLAETPRGSFHVIYPDPAFKGCEQVSRESEAFNEIVPFIPKWEADEDQLPTPTTHWWFAFLVERIENGPFVYQSLFFDELADWVPQHASNDDTKLYAKIEALRSVLGESRRRKLSVFGYLQEEVDLHAKTRRRFDWRVAMPERPNPSQANNDSVVGFRKIPMEYDTMSGRSPGTGLVYNTQNFNWFTWSDIQDDSLEIEGSEESKWLKITVKTPSAAVSTSAVDRVEFDDQLFSLERRGESAYLVVNDPGSGYLDVEDGFGEELVSPIDDLDLELYHHDGEGWKAVLVDPDSERRRTVARLEQLSQHTDSDETEVGR